MGFRKRKRRSVAVALTLSAFAAVTVLILAQRWNIRQEGDDGLLVVPASTHLDHSVKGVHALPSCIVIGSRKGGTRALLDMLSLHSRVRPAKAEVHFFDADDNYRRGYQWYMEQMPRINKEKGEIAIEKTPSYFVTEAAPARVYNMSDKVLLLLVVRDPVTRLISDYAQILENHRKRNLEYKSFEEAAFHANSGAPNRNYDAIQKSIYAAHVRRWLALFPLSQLHVVHGERFIRKPWHELAKIERFLNLPSEIRAEQFYFNATKGFHCYRTRRGTKEHCLDKSKGRKHPAVPDRLISRLRKFFTPYNYEFYNLVQRDFGWPEE